MAATILVVEDEPAIQELVACNLELAGHRTLRADSAEQALRMVRDELPDLIVLDWMLPGINGIEFARRLRSDKRTQTVPLIMLTARAEEQDKLAGLETGADDYITKPFSPRELNARVKAVRNRSCSSLESLLGRIKCWSRKGRTDSPRAASTLCGVSATTPRAASGKPHCCSDTASATRAKYPKPLYTPCSISTTDFSFMLLPSPIIIFV